jgi:peptidoglycan/LPS O-acetylase OafA/YrhL
VWLFEEHIVVIVCNSHTEGSVWWSFLYIRCAVILESILGWMVSCLLTEEKMTASNEGLLGLRGFLAFSVVIYHIYISGVLEKYIYEYPKENLLYFINYVGPISVNIFFVISGFLIIKSLTNKRTIKFFFLNRILRIYPVFLTIHLFIFTVGPLIGYKWMVGIGFLQYSIHFFSNFFLLPGMFPLPIAQIVAWSLSYELTFYVLSGIVFFIYRNQYLNNYLKYIFYVFFALICIAIIYIRPNALFFIVGIALFLGEDQIKKLYKPKKIFYFNGIIFLALIYLSYGKEPFNIFIPALLCFLFFLSIITEHGLISKFLQINLLQYLGKISYSLYMWHTFIMFPLKKLMPKISLYVFNTSFTFIIYAVLTIVLSIITSHLSYKYIEIKLTDYLKQLLMWRKNYKPVRPIFNEKN